MKPLLLIAIALFGAAILFILLLSSRLFEMTGQLSSDIGRSLSRDSEIERLAKEIQDLRGQLSILKHSIGQREPFREGPRAAPGASLPPSSSSAFASDWASVKFRNEAERKRILVTGGAGFVGSHLVDRLMREGHEVIALDNFFTGRRRNVEQWVGHPNFELVHHDVVNPFYSEVDRIYHLASPASPPHYMHNPVKTLKTNTLGTINMLGLARRVKARLLFASTSEVYGDPEVSPQPETYFGRVNTVGPRSCYDEGKRAGEALLMAFHRHERVDIRIARIFNTFGPRMHINDGRVVSNFITQALRGAQITIYGDGHQTRSFQFISDLVDGLIALMESNTTEPVNIGNPEEYSIAHFAQIIRNLTGSSSELVHLPGTPDDPQQRRPNIQRAANLLGWRPRVAMLDGLRQTVRHFRGELEHEGGGK